MLALNLHLRVIGLKETRRLPSHVRDNQIRILWHQLLSALLFGGVVAKSRVLGWLSVTGSPWTYVLYLSLTAGAGGF